MPHGRPRVHRRSSPSSSYASTLILATFILLCIAGGWMLTSHSIRVPSLSSTYATFNTGAEFPTTGLIGRKEGRNFEGSLGGIENAVKVDNKVPQGGNGVDKSFEEKSLEAMLENAKVLDDHDGPNRKGSNEENKSNKEESQEVGVHVGDPKGDLMKVEEIPQGLERKESVEETEKQRLGENQVSEESSLTVSELEESQKTSEENQKKPVAGEKNEEQNSLGSSESVLEAQRNEMVGDQPNVLSQQRQNNVRNETSLEPQKHVIEGQKQEQEQVRQRQEDAGIIHENSQQSQIQTTDENQQGKQPSSISRDEIHKQMTSQNEFEDVTSHEDQREDQHADLHEVPKHYKASDEGQQDLHELPRHFKASHEDEHSDLHELHRYHKASHEDQHSDVHEEVPKRSKVSREDQREVPRHVKATHEDHQSQTAVVVDPVTLQHESEDNQGTHQETIEDANLIDPKSTESVSRDQTIRKSEDSNNNWSIQTSESDRRNQDGTVEEKYIEPKSIESQSREQNIKTSDDSNNSWSTKASQSDHQNQDTTMNAKHIKSKSTESQSKRKHTRKSKAFGNAWSTQASQSDHQKGRQLDDRKGNFQHFWKLCNVTEGSDYIPCLDNKNAIRLLHYTGHYEHRERHCPEEAPTCLVPLPEGYKKPIRWPASREKIWYKNVPHPTLAGMKGHQNWVKVKGEFLTFPGGGTQFVHGAFRYIQFIEESEPSISWGKRTRAILDVGCGVASFGGYLFDKDVLTMSFAPKDEHEAQVQFALERGIPAISAVMGSQRLPFPSMVFDLLHCARCRVPWHREGGLLLLELNRLLRPGGYFVWSATPVYQKLEEDVAIWNAMESLTKSICWKLVSITKDKVNAISAAIYQKPTSNACYYKRTENSPPMCERDDNPDAAWYTPLQACLHGLPENEAERGFQWPVDWPLRLRTPPYWLNSSQKGIYGRPAHQDFMADFDNWREVVRKSYKQELGIRWSVIRNVMDMRSVYGGFAAALKELKLWVMNVINIDSADTLPIIFERGLFGMYHDWCESFSTYPRSYDLLHADRLFSMLKRRCNNTIPVMAEVDRILRPGGILIARDEPNTIDEIEILLRSLHWKVLSNLPKGQERLLSAEKTFWRPSIYAASSN